MSSADPAPPLGEPPGQDAAAASAESVDRLPPALSSMWRLCRLGFRYEPALMGVSFVLALARALCAVQLGAGVVLLDEPTAQLDVRGEAEIFDRILAATRDCTTILISHRFSTVRHADRICVLEQGRVVELGTHDELMARGGRYRTMFELQAKRFGATEDEEGQAYDVLA